jgi:glycosyltransferase involved in cell wall biosynthesis
MDEYKPKGKMSIIVLNWNRLHYTKQTVESIMKKTSMPHELIFVDNGSVDGTREYLKDMENKTNADKVIYVFNDKNLGVAGGRNSGLVHASGDYLVTIDDDILVPDKWDLLMAKACDKIPQLGITGVNVEPIKFPVQDINGARVRPKAGNLGGACLCLPKRVFKRVGYYNYFSTYGHEDAAMYYRLVHLGLMSAYIEPKGIHLDKDADKAYRKAKNDAHAKNSVQLRALSYYRLILRKTGDVYVPFDPNFEPEDLKIFTTDLIMKDRKK